LHFFIKPQNRDDHDMYTRSEVDWKNEHAVGVVSAKAQNAGAARAAARLCNASGGRNGK